MRPRYYYSDTENTLETIAENAGVPFEDVLRFNPQWYGKRIPAGTRILVHVEGESKNSGNKDEESGGGSSANSIEKMQKIESYKNDVAAAQKDYSLGVSEAKLSLDSAKRKLAESLRQNRQRLESNLAAQKITSSSIAEQEKELLENNGRAELDSAQKQFEAKKDKLAATLEKKKTSAENKIKYLL